MDNHYDFKKAGEYFRYKYLGIIAYIYTYSNEARGISASTKQRHK